MPLIITRGNNVYGPGQYPEKLIPKFIQLAVAGKKLTIQGDGSCKRGFLHITDTVDAFITVFNKGHVGEIYNIGCDSSMEYTVMDVAKIIIREHTGKELLPDDIIYVEDRPFNDKRYYIDNNKLKQLGWTAKTSLEDGIRELLSLH